ncbi:MAG: GerMN domain-containing protein [Lachnospiraceae bacterium]|nr:GerMN domain-containing protein [Lachnospiraceae bacterium]
MVSKSKRLTALLVSLLLVAGVSSVFTGCKSSDGEVKKDYQLYYINSARDSLKTVKYNAKKTDKVELANELMNAINETSSKINMINAIPSNVEVVGWNVDDSVMYINFDSEYLEMDRSNEILCRAALVLTFTQITGIEYVHISVEGEPIKDSFGKNVGNMKSADFIDNSGSSIKSYEKRKAEIYFASEGGTGLEAVTVETLSAVTDSMEMFILEQLKKGTSDKNARSTIPSGVKINGVNTKDGVCYVDFSEEFLSAVPNITPEVELYSIVNSLCELPHVNKVQITINGTNDKKFRDKISLEKLFERNLDIVKSNNKK